MSIRPALAPGAAVCSAPAVDADAAAAPSDASVAVRNVRRSMVVMTRKCSRASAVTSGDFCSRTLHKDPLTDFLRKDYASTNRRDATERQERSLGRKASLG